jgi:GT2 family glycosyltransferase/glycosyltransferase involved in cell wall biosynthesis
MFRNKRKRTTMDGSLCGNFDGFVENHAVGWASLPRQSEKKVLLDIIVDGATVATATADRYRPDLDSSLPGGGYHGFRAQLDRGIFEGEPRKVRVKLHGTDLELPGSPQIVGDGSFDGCFDPLDGRNVRGWVCARTAKALPVNLEIWIDDQIAGYALANQERTDLAAHGFSDTRIGYVFKLPDRALDGTWHRIAVRVAGHTESWIGCPQYFQADYVSHIDLISEFRIAGWIYNRSSSNEPVKLDLLINDETVGTFVADHPRPDISASGRGPTNAGFDIALPALPSNIGVKKVSLRVSGTTRPVLQKPVVFTPRDVVIRSLITAAEALNEIHNNGERALLSSSLNIDGEALAYTRTQIIPQLLEQIRASSGPCGELRVHVKPYAEVQAARFAPERKVDVIVPVYRGLQETLDCIHSALAAVNDKPAELIVINDLSPDPELTKQLRVLARTCPLTLLENDQNLGFVGTVNRGMQLHPERDVILLNSDTVVPSGWIDRLHRAAYKEKNIGTVTPFSNNATICSFPRMNADNDLPPGISLDELDDAAEAANAGVAVDIPTAVGFCMYIKRDALSEVGYFNQELFGKGYGEENDFCLRAANLGWRHVLACDLFVEHRGSVSFLGDKDLLVTQNLGTLGRLYPEYGHTIQRFISQDPIAAARRGLAMSLLRAQVARAMLFVMHTLGGGATRAANDLAEQLRDEDQRVLILWSARKDKWRLSCYGEPFEIDYAFPHEFESLISDLRELGVWHVHYHQTIHFPDDVWKLAGLLNVEYDVTVHDYAHICPRVNLIDDTGRYCGEPAADVCDRCIEFNCPYPGIEPVFEARGGTIADWRRFSAESFQEARRIFAPSEDAGARLLRYFNLPNLVVQPHPEQEHKIRPVMGRADDTVSVAVIGAIGPHKGFETLLACARSAHIAGLPLKFVVIGYTCDDAAIIKYKNVIITGKYDHAELELLLNRHQCQLAAFFSVWPETYSYTLSEAWRAGLYPVTFDIGATAERVRQTGYGRIIPFTPNPKKINSELLAAAYERTRIHPLRLTGISYENLLHDYYGLAAVGAPAMKLTA